MTPEDLICFIIFMILLTIVCNWKEWASNNRTTPPGYHKDRDMANRDLTLYGKDYYHTQNLAGKYDVPDNKK